MIPNPVSYYLSQPAESRLLLWQIIAVILLFLTALNLSVDAVREREYGFIFSRLDILEERAEQHERNRTRYLEEIATLEKKSRAQEEEINELYRQQNQLSMQYAHVLNLQVQSQVASRATRPSAAPRRSSRPTPSHTPAAPLPTPTTPTTTP